MEDLSPIGLIYDEKIKNSYINKFKVSFNPDKNIQVYISNKHGNGAGKYKINNVNVNGQKVVLSLDFKKNMFEAGASVINQRILFFSVQRHCEIIDILLTN